MSVREPKPIVSAEEWGAQIAADLTAAKAEITHLRAQLHETQQARCGTCRWWQGRLPTYRLCSNPASECGNDDSTSDLMWSAQHSCPHWEVAR